MARVSWTRRRVGAVVGVVVAVVLGAVAFGTTRGSHPKPTKTTRPVVPSSPATTGPIDHLGIHKIRHVVVIMQENRSFDSYFGTYPGADGIPMNGGVPAACLPDPVQKTCIKPFPDHGDVNVGGPHAAGSARNDIDNGRMDGF